MTTRLQAGWCMTLRLYLPDVGRCQDRRALAKINGSLVAIPSREESRLKDIESGILTQDDIDTTISPGKNPAELLVPNHERDTIVTMAA